MKTSIDGSSHGIQNKKFKYKETAMRNVDWKVGRVCCNNGPHDMRDSVTIGLKTNYNHPELQLVLPLSDRDCMYILNTLAFRIQNGERLKTGMVDKRDEFGCDFRLDYVYRQGDYVFRVIVPDPQMRFPEDPLCEEPYKYQTRIMFEAPCPHDGSLSST